VGTVLLPMLSKQIRSGDHAAARTSMNRALELVLLFGLPCTAALMVIAEPIIRVLYQHGAFTPANMVATKAALVAFTAGLPAFLAVKIFAPGFYANHDTKTPFKIAVACVAINLFFNLTLIGPFRHVGMAMATSIAGWVNVIAMMVILHKRGLFVPDALLKSRLTKMLGPVASWPSSFSSPSRFSSRSMKAVFSRKPPPLLLSSSSAWPSTACRCWPCVPMTPASSPNSFGANVYDAEACII